MAFYAHPNIVTVGENPNEVVELLDPTAFQPHLIQLTLGDELWLPDVSPSSPSDSLLLPDALLWPGEALLFPSDAMLSPVGNLLSPVGEHLSPVGEHLSHVGDLLSPVGDLLSPVGEHLSPVGDLLSPVGEHLSPVGELLSPVGELLSLGDGQQTPSLSTLLPADGDGDQDTDVHSRTEDVDLSWLGFDLLSPGVDLLSPSNAQWSLIDTLLSPGGTHWSVVEAPLSPGDGQGADGNQEHSDTNVENRTLDSQADVDKEDGSSHQDEPPKMQGVFDKEQGGSEVEGGGTIDHVQVFYHAETFYQQFQRNISAPLDRGSPIVRLWRVTGDGRLFLSDHLNNASSSQAETPARETRGTSARGKSATDRNQEHSDINVDNRTLDSQADEDKEDGLSHQDEPPKMQGVFDKEQGGSEEEGGGTVDHVQVFYHAETFYQQFQRNISAPLDRGSPIVRLWRVTGDGRLFLSDHLNNASSSQAQTPARETRETSARGKSAPTKQSKRKAEKDSRRSPPKKKTNRRPI